MSRYSVSIFLTYFPVAHFVVFKALSQITHGRQSKWYWLTCHHQSNLPPFRACITALLIYNDNTAACAPKYTVLVPPGLNPAQVPLRLQQFKRGVYKVSFRPRPDDVLIGSCINNVRLAYIITSQKSSQTSLHLHPATHDPRKCIDLWWGHFGHMAPDLTQFSVVILPQVRYSGETLSSDIRTSPTFLQYQKPLVSASWGRFTIDNLNVDKVRRIRLGITPFLQHMMVW